MSISFSHIVNCPLKVSSKKEQKRILIHVVKKKVFLKTMNKLFSN